MTLKELKSVKNFLVANEHGSIEWIGYTDLTGVDLADCVTIQSKLAEVYDDEGKHLHSKPQRGEKLNKPAIIELNNMKPRPNQTIQQKEAKLKASL